MARLKLKPSVMDGDRALRARFIYSRALKEWETFSEPDGLGTQLLYLLGAVLTDTWVDLWVGGGDDEVEMLRWLQSKTWKNCRWIRSYYKIRRSDEQ